MKLLLINKGEFGADEDNIQMNSPPLSLPRYAPQHIGTSPPLGEIAGRINAGSSNGRIHQS